MPCQPSRMIPTCIHPGLLSAFETGRLSALLQKFADDELAVPAELMRDEALLMAILPALSTR
jgi:hypothetical protein